MSARFGQSLRVGLIAGIAYLVSMCIRIAVGAISPLDALVHAAIACIVATVGWFAFASLRKRAA